MTYANAAITRAMKAVQAAIPKAEGDPRRPVYHFRPPAQWMNDPNGTIYHQGFYHVFYQHNPYGDEWGHIHWGHARSKDLVHWEHLPIALWPSLEKGEVHCYSGCARINGRGEPMLFYTKVAASGAPFEQWAATSPDDDLLTWEKHPGNPIIDLKTHGGPSFGHAWRDPFIFQDRGRTFLVLSADLGDEAVIPIYEAGDLGLVRWEYRGILYRVPKTETRFFECPNFFKLGDRWVLLCSPYGPVEYMVGSFDLETLAFESETKGLLDHCDDFYATNVIVGEDARCVLVGWIQGWKNKGRGWSGCLSLPRILTITEGGALRQRPAPELEMLRDKHVRWESVLLDDATRAVQDFKGGAFGVCTVIEPKGAHVTGVRLRDDVSGRPVATVQLGDGGERLSVADRVFPFKLRGEPLVLRIFFDRSVIEVFVNAQETCTKVLETDGGEVGLEVFAQGGRALVRSLDAWEMRAVW